MRKSSYVSISVQYCGGWYLIKDFMVSKGHPPYTDDSGFSVCADWMGHVTIGIASRVSDEIDITIDEKVYKRKLVAGLNHFNIDTNFADGIIGVALDDEGKEKPTADDKLRDFLSQLRDLIDKFLEEEEEE